MLRWKCGGNVRRRQGMPERRVRRQVVKIERTTTCDEGDVASSGGKGGRLAIGSVGLKSRPKCSSCSTDKVRIRGLRDLKGKDCRGFREQKAGKIEPSIANIKLFCAKFAV